MKSIKPGRGPSALAGIENLAAAGGGILFIIVAYNMMDGSSFRGFGSIFPLFGVFTVLAALARAFYHFSNTTRENRFSQFDITSGTEEPDPLNQRFGPPAIRPISQAKTRTTEDSYCPYCGAGVAQDFEFCPKCGRDI